MGALKPGDVVSTPFLRRAVVVSIRGRAALIGYPVGYRRQEWVKNLTPLEEED